ncbi:MAG: asparagine synthase C-terminal domain-containing protein, partial [Phycisphaerales bacterium]|nr:asparagine synthase C-terminal domain-containing protein [Phycisphaerales bacterium]
GMGGMGVMLFASEIRAVLAHPRFDARPDLLTMSAYLSTIRPEFGRRTMFEGVSSLEPGEWAWYSTSTYECLESCSCWDGGGAGAECVSEIADTRSVIEDSILRHLRTDVPMCSLLSGGIDSSIIARVAMDELGELHTFCAGARSEGFADDFAMAARVAEYLGTDHTEVEIDSAGFLGRWRGMVDATGVPLSTPNEVAIYEVCRVLRERGFTVALSGEGADELFGGYELPMIQAQSYVDHIPDSDLSAGLFHLNSNAWVSDELKPVIMQADWLGATDSDSLLKVWYQLSFERLRAGCSGSMQAHLAFHRRMNLPNLLRRLDTASMLCSVEGRTPLADRAVSDFAESLAMKDKFVNGNPAGTKIALREAFAGRLPDEVVRRPKASFPLPFQEWIGGRVGVLKKSGFAQDIFRSEAIDAVVGDPAGNWNLAWPMMNLAMWGERWWGDGAVVDEVFGEVSVMV